MEKDTLLGRAYNIIHERGEEKDRDYGPFRKSLEDTATIASIMCGKDIKWDDVSKILVALKLSRIGKSKKEDNYLDAIAYLAGEWENRDRE